MLNKKEETMLDWIKMTILLLFFGLFGLFVWPGRYYYESQNDKSFEKKFYRIDRLTGEVSHWDRVYASWEIYRFRNLEKDK